MAKQYYLDKRVLKSNLTSTTGLSSVLDLNAFVADVVNDAASTFADGTVSLPGIAFASDTDSGVYRVGSNNLGVAVNGAKVLDIATTGLSVTGTLSASSAATITSASAVSLTVGRLGATTPAFTVDSSTASQVAGLKVTGAATGGTVAIVTTDSGTDTNLTINAKGTGTIGIGSVSTGAVTITPATTVTGVLTPTGGVAAGGGFTFAPNLVHTGDIPASVSTFGAELTITNTELYVAQVFIPANCTVTGVAFMTGTTTDGNAKVALFNSAGARVAISASTDISGFTADTYNRVAFSSTYAAKGPATYYVGIICDTNTNIINTHTFGDFRAGKITGLVYATEAGYATITPPTTFTTALGPIASLY